MKKIKFRLGYFSLLQLLKIVLQQVVLYETDWNDSEKLLYKPAGLPLKGKNEINFFLVK